MGIVAVLVDKGVIIESELRGRLEQAARGSQSMLRRSWCRGRVGGHADLLGTPAREPMKDRWHVKDRWHDLELVVAILLTAVAIAWLIALVAVWTKQG
jgi:hypothetical protein